jgi:glycosyltransferase involved in cell wall biosynthesis
MNSPLPIGVVIPTLNCVRLLPAHLDSMACWLHAVEQVVVVDSHSNDGTVEMIRERLNHPHITFHQRPRGLYQAWNFGLAQLHTEYAYVSTVGDSITFDGLEHLHEVADRFSCDAVISKPHFIEADGTPIEKEVRWPIDDVLATLRLSQPATLEGLRLFIFVLFNNTDAILGSSASNLYRTEVMKARPFPVEFGTVGDGAWGLANALDVRIGITPQQFSTFRYHPKSYAISDYAVADLKRKLFLLATSTFEERLKCDAQLRATATRIGCDELARLVRLRLDSQEQLEATRHRWFPWVFNPAAWRARAIRNRLRREISERKASVIRELDLDPQADV